MPKRQYLDLIAGDAVIKMMADFGKMDAPDIVQFGVFRNGTNFGQHR